MINRPVKRKLLKAKIALSQTIQKILDINRKKKKLTFAENQAKKEKALNEELKLLNKIAEKQAFLVRKYENHLMEVE